MKHIIYKILVGLAIISFLVAAGLVVWDYYLTRERLPYNTYIGTIDVSLLTEAEAAQKIRQAPPDIVAVAPLIVYYKDKDFFYLPSELGLRIDADGSVRRAFQITHGANYIRELRTRISKDAVRFSPVLVADPTILRQAVASLTEKINQPSAEAKVVLLGKGAYSITRHQSGRKLNIDESVNSIIATLAKGDKLLPLIVDEVRPRITAEDLEYYPPVQLLSQFTTYYGSHDSPNRIHNIRLIGNTLVDGTLLLSGEVFSLLNKIGDINEERGFRQAFVIVDGELEPQFGGGTCQIATTLFNTVLLADLEIVNRKNHSLYFYIYPLGRDATVYGKGLDFKFRNNTGHPIMIKALANNHSLTFRVYGTPTGKTVSFVGPTVYYRDAEGNPRVGWRAPKDTPFSTSVTKIVKKDGKVISKDVFRSYYKMVGDSTNVVIRRPEPR